MFSKGGTALKVNGNEVKFTDGVTVGSLVDSYKLDRELVVVELDYEIIKKEDYESRILDESSNVEIVAFVGGG